jgi:hypothetical protein
MDYEWMYDSGRHVIDFVLMKRKNAIMVGLIPASVSNFDNRMLYYVCARCISLNAHVPLNGFVISPIIGSKYVDIGCLGGFAYSYGEQCYIYDHTGLQGADDFVKPKCGTPSPFSSPACCIV